MELLLPKPVHRAPLVFPDDELGPLLRAFALEQEEGTATQFLGPVNQRLTTPWGPGGQFPWSEMGSLDDEILGSGGLKNFARENEEGTDTLRTVNQRESAPWGPGQQFPWSDGAFLDDEVQGSGGLKNFYRDDEAGTDTLPTVNRTLSNPFVDRPFVDDEISAGLQNFGLEQEEGSPTLASVNQTQSGPWLPVPFFEDMTSAGLGYFPIEQEDDYLRAVEGLPWLSRPFTDDDLPPNPRNFYRDDEAAPAPVLPVLWWTYPAWTANPSVDEDPISVAPTFLGVDQEEPAYVRTESQPWLAIPFSDDETSAQLARFALEQEEPAYLRVESISWLPVPFADEAAIPPQLGLGQEEPWIGRTTLFSWPQPFVPGDESATVTVPFGLDPGEGWTAVTPWGIWRGYVLFLPAADEATSFTPPVRGRGGFAALTVYVGGFAAAATYVGGPAAAEPYSGGVSRGDAG